ncbi:MAG: FtsX-like permease family protein [Bacilli bacterium]
MKNRVVTNSFRTINKNRARFCSLMMMSFLATFTYSGINNTAPDFKYSIDKYFDAHNHYDIKIQSDMGMSLNDVSYIKDVDGVLEVEGAHSIDCMISLPNEEAVINISSLTSYINTVDLIDGRLPFSNNEIVVEEKFLSKNEMNLGDTINISSTNLIEDTFTIVGTVKSTLYINNAETTSDRGNTSIGIGVINYYTFVNPEAFDQDYYTSIYITVDGAKNKITSSDNYDNLIESVTKNIEKIKKEGESRREDEIKTPLYEKVEEAEENGLNELSIVKSQLDILQTNLDNLYNYMNTFEPTSEEYYALNLQYINKLNEYNAAYIEYNESYNNFIIEIENAYEEIDDIQTPTWYINNRNDYTTYREFIDDAQSVANLGQVFPIVFFIVATLISLISMSRLVEDERTEIGTLKSLGFSNIQIMGKYIFFAFVATICGGIVGGISGGFVVPSIIYGIYKILFDVPTMVLKLDVLISLIPILISCVCIVGATLVTALRVLKEKPAELMRPKAPKQGKRVLLEKIPFIWNKINFSNKITIRNIGRYKKRVFATVFGIMGCTALMLTGFGLKDSLSCLAGKQFGEVYNFDTMVLVNNYDPTTDLEIFNDPNITSTTPIQLISGTASNTNINWTVVEDNETLDTFVNLYDKKTQEPVHLEKGKVVITNKLAEIKNVSVGDKIELKDSNNKSAEFEISAIVEIYFQHYVFMDRETFEDASFTYKPNCIYLHVNEMSEEQQDAFTKSLLENEKVLSVQFISVMVDNVDDMLSSLNNVVIILIVLAALLAFVVLYNLSNINIHERKREIATLKLLGFYNKEVDSYITKENIILTIVGVALGLLGGYFLTGFVLKTVEIEKASFILGITWVSYLVSAALAFVFTFIVNFITHFSLKKIDMIESLKSVE